MRLRHASTADLEVRRDLRRTHAELAPLRDALPAASGRTVVVLALGEAIYGVKLLLMLATGLRLQGWKVVVLAEDRTDPWTARYASAFGIADTRYFSDVTLLGGERDVVAHAAAELFEGPLDFPTVKNWTFRDAWIGPQLLATVARQTMRGAPDPTDPKTQDRLRALLPHTVDRVLRAESLLSDLRPDLGIVIEPNYAANGAIVDVAVRRGTPVVHVTQPWRDDALMCRRLVPGTRRQHSSSLSPDSLRGLVAQGWGNAEEDALRAELADRYEGTFFLQSRNQPGTRGFERAELVDRFGLDPGKPLAVVFSHILWDANLFYGEDLFDDYGHWFVETARAAAANSEVNWLIKLHPANVWKRTHQGETGEYAETVLLREHIGELPAHVKVLPADSEVSSLSLYQHADVAVTVRGTPGMEMAVFGKPIVTAGTGRYSGLGFTLDSTSREEYLERLAHIADLPPLDDEQLVRAKWHALAVFRMRHWYMKSFRSVFDCRHTGAHPLDHNLELVARSVEEIEAQDDLRKWADWAAGSDIDYLDHG